MTIIVEGQTSIQSEITALKSRAVSLETMAAAGMRVLWALRGADMNVDTDQALVKQGTFGSFVIVGARAFNASTSLTTAVGGIYTAAAKAGIAVVAANQAYSALTAATIGADLTVAAAGKDELSATTLILSLSTPQGGAATADILVYGFATS